VVKLLLIFLVLAAMDVIWWRSAELRLRRWRKSLPWRLLLGLFMLAQIGYLLELILAEFVYRLPAAGPVGLAVVIYIWHVLGLPLGLSFFAVGWLARKWQLRKPTVDAVSSASVPDLKDSDTRFTRRDLLGAAASAIPPLFAIAASRKGFEQMGEFRIRRVTLSLAQLPPDLHGLTIAHVTDLHIGRFMPLELTGPIANAINGLSCDLIAFTGDLLDASCVDVRPGIDFMRRLNPRHGLVMIEGNHDVNFNADLFEGEMKSARLPLLLDESMTFSIPGRATPVQFLGISWGELITGKQLQKVGKARNHFFREPSDSARADSVQRVKSLRDPGAFPILLAHHPHAFDPAAAAGFPLVLSGHTHGGQLMLTRNIGAGPIRFRYWTGLYEKPNSQLFISNGIGSWFPLRVNAPAEIVHLTLAKA
jgi:predicted MPP superfamily phosphohydrolase